MRLTSRVVALAIVGLLAPVVGAQETAKHGVQADQRIPEDTYLYFSMPSVNVMKARWGQAHGAKLYEDPAFDDIKAEVMNAFGEQFEEMKNEISENLGLTPMELLQIPSGQVSLGVSSLDDEVGFIMFVDFGDSRRAVDGLLKKAAEGMAQDGIEMTTEEYSGTEINVLTLPEMDENAFVPALHYCIRDTELVISTSMPLMKNALSNWDGSDSETFVANEKWSYVKERCGSGNKHASINWFVDPIGMFNAVANTGLMPELGFAQAMLPTTGLHKLDGMGGTMDMAVGKFDVISRMVYLCKEPEGLLKVFTLKEGNMAPPSWVPAAVAMYSGTNWDIAGAYKAVETLADGLSGPGGLAQQIDEMAEGGFGIHLKDDIIDQLTGKIQMIGAAGEAVDAAAPAGATALLSGKMAVALGCKDEGAMKALLTKLTETGGFPGEVREFRDTTLIEIPNPDGQTMGLGVTRGNLMMSTDITFIEELIRGSDNPLAGSDAYKRVAAEFPSQTMGVTFTDAKSSYKSTYESFRSGDLGELFPGMGDILENIDFKKLPPFEAVAKYLLPTGGFTIADDRGAFSQSFTLKP